jgi:hypothetical protein
MYVCMSRWNQRPKLKHYVATCGKLTTAMALDKRTALHAGPTPGGAGAAGGAPQVMTIGDDGVPTAATAGGEPAATAAAAAEAEEDKAEADEAQPEIFDINSYDDEAKKAALKMQQCGRGMLARKHVKKAVEINFSEAVPDVSADKMWDVLGDFEVPGLFLSLLRYSWICIYTFMYINTYIHSYIHKCIHTYIRTYMHACIHTCIHM